MHNEGREIRRNHIIYHALRIAAWGAMFGIMAAWVLVCYHCGIEPKKGHFYVVLVISALAYIGLCVWGEKFHAKEKALFKQHFITPLAAEYAPGIKYLAKGECDAKPITDWTGGTQVTQEDTFRDDTARLPYTCSEVRSITERRRNVTNFRGYVWHIKADTSLCSSMTYYAYSYDRITLNVFAPYGTPADDREIGKDTFKRIARTTEKFVVYTQPGAKRRFHMTRKMRQALIALGEEFKAYRIIVAVKGTDVWIGFDTRRDLFEFGLLFNEAAIDKMARQIYDINTVPERCGLAEMIQTRKALTGIL